MLAVTAHLGRVKLAARVCKPVARHARLAWRAESSAVSEALLHCLIAVVERHSLFPVTGVALCEADAEDNTLSWRQILSRVA